ncbi:nitrilase and fragile histidine triad fusion protein NitFhit [Thozetella sp. PMI_491]|nr:nitrilase and fragile histidine triad fusion protein NitFhit [Thozetella sp. PMI_491]
MAIAAIGQICSTASMAHNLEQCVRLARKAATVGAKVLFLPEASDYIAGSPQESLSLARPVAQSPFVLGLQSVAKTHRLAINVGIHVPVSVIPATACANPVVPDQPGDDPEQHTQTKLYNRTIWINSNGDVCEPGNYDKLHLFDYGNLRESAHTQGGSKVIPPFDTPVGRVGSLICFDMRFPEPALRLAQPPASLVSQGFQPAHIVTYPSAFTIKTGRAHWELLLRARAIETQSYVIAAAQVGPHNEKRTSYGHSMAVDPWGRVLCHLGGVAEDDSIDSDAIGALGLIEIDLEEWARVRREMPLVRRTDVYPEL